MTDSDPPMSSDLQAALTSLRAEREARRETTTQHCEICGASFVMGRFNEAACPRCGTVHTYDEAIHVELSRQQIDYLRVAMGLVGRLHDRGPHGPLCGAILECGGACVMAPEHGGPCLCAGDEPNMPGTCPA